MKVELHIASGWVGVKYKKRRELFVNRPPGFKLSTGTAVCVVYSRRAAIRVAPFYNEKLTDEWVRGRFPLGEKFNDTTHVFGYEKINQSAVFAAALPVTVVDRVREVCESVGIKNNNIRRIDLIERLLFKKYAGGESARWVCFPLDNGLRVLSISNGLPKDVFFISNDPGYRDAELAGLSLPDEAVVFDGCDWLKTVLHEAHVKVFNEGGIYEAV